MDKSFEIKGYINNVLKETGLEGADAFDKALLLNALGKLERQSIVMNIRMLLQVN